jgi:hypothetical protein
LLFFTIGPTLVCFENFLLLLDSDDDEEGDEDEDADAGADAGLAPVRDRYLIRSHRRRDRLVKTIAAAQDRNNYNMLPEVTDEKMYEVTVKGTVLRR